MSQAIINFFARNHLRTKGPSYRFDLGLVAYLVDATGAKPASDSVADITLALSPDTLEALLTGTTRPLDAFMAGKLRIKGDMRLLFGLDSLLRG